MEPNYLLEGFNKIDTDLQELMLCFREVLEELGEHAVAALLPWKTDFDKKTVLHQQEPLSEKAFLEPVSMVAAADEGQGVDGTQELSVHKALGAPKPIAAAVEHEDRFSRLEQATSIAFQLLNIVEATAAARTRRLRESGSGLTAERGLWGEKLLQLKTAGISAEKIATFLPQVRVEPVFTAHPTEAKRGTVLEQHRLLYQLLQTADREKRTPSEKKAHRCEIKICLEKLWRSGEVFLDQPSIADERREILFYFGDILPKAVLRLDERLRAAWEEVGFSPNLIAAPDSCPQLRFGTWVGGDRDGHPFVTAEVTSETLVELRRSALKLLDQQLHQLSKALPLSRHFQQPSEELLALIERFTQELGTLGSSLCERHRDEPWRQLVLLIQAKLPSFQHPNEVQVALQVLEKSLLAIKAQRLVQSTLWPVMRLLDVFGFHLAALDIRQNSAFHDRALAQILEAAQIPDAASFPEWSEEKRLAFLRKELCSSICLLPSGQDISALGKDAQGILSCYSTLHDHVSKHGTVGLGSLIVSMTRRLSDLLVVVLLAREGGLAQWNGTTHYSLLPIVPLFETREDLLQSATLLDHYLREPSTIASLQQQGNKDIAAEGKFSKRLVQQVMIGYSDSNKDCGIMASQWELHEAQRAMTEVASALGIGMLFFHGRGGTISRGAGPTHLFLKALPGGSLQGNLRMTEQGETIAQKYANSSTATYHLELLLAGVTSASLTNKQEENSGLNKTASFLANRSRNAYQTLIQSDGFLSFYEQATPLDALEACRIGSRPKRRSDQRSLADLRAIPWVFSWNQARYFLPGWFGVGSALVTLEQERPELFEELIQQHRHWPFLNYVLSNVETNLSSADLVIMEKYASLVIDDKIRSRIFNIISDEFKKTQQQLQKIFGGTLQERRPRMGKTLALRAEALAFLHEQQIITLQAWRQAQQNNPAHAIALLPKVLLSINAIASGLRTTG